MYRLSPTLIDSIEFYQSVEFDNTDEGTIEEKQAAKLAELVAQIKREPRPASEPMMLGSAFHQLIEEPQQFYQPEPDTFVVEQNGRIYQFAADILLDIDVTEGLKELPGTLELNCGVAMNLRPDTIIGNGCIEYKTTGSSIDADKYVKNIQWRCYLLAFSLAWCEYRIAKLSKNLDGVYFLADYQTFQMYRYPNLQDDVERRAVSALGFVDSIGLLDVITIKEAA